MSVRAAERFKVGDRVTVKPGQEHMDMEPEMSGEVRSISPDAAYAIRFDGEAEDHKWYVDGELNAESGGGGGGGMRANKTARRADPAAMVKGIKAFRASAIVRRLEAKKSDGAGKTGELFIYDVIGADWFGGISAKDVARALESLRGVEQLNIYINSPGGDVFDGVAIYNQIRRFEGKKTVFVDGLAASAASVIALAGDTVITAQNAMWMIHHPWTIALGSAPDFRKVADELDKISGVLIETYAARTKQTPKDIRAWMDDETWMTADEAMERGFTDEVAREDDGEEAAAALAAPAAPAPSNRAIIDPVLNKYKNTPEPLRSAAASARVLIESMERKNNLRRASPSQARRGQPDAPKR